MLTIAELKKSSYLCCGKGMLVEALLTRGEGKNERMIEVKELRS